MDCCRLRVGQRSADDGVDEARLVGAKDPGDPHDAMVRGGIQHLVIPFQLGHSVMAQRAGFILFGIRAPESPVEDVVGADMHKTRSPEGTEPRDAAGSLGVDLGSRDRVALTAVDVCGRRAVHHDIAGPEFEGGQCRLGFLRLGEVYLNPGQGKDLDIGKG